MLRIIGYIWLAGVVVVLLYLLLPVIEQPSRLRGPAGPEYIVPQLFASVLLSLPGILLLLLARRRKR